MQNAVDEIKWGLVNRQEQVDEFNKLLDKLIFPSSSLQSPLGTLQEWFGGPGIGKTTLIQMLQRECQRRHVPYASINFREEKKNNRDSAWYEQRPEFLLEKLASQLLPGKQKDTGEFRQWESAVAAFRSESSYPENLVQDYFNLSRSQRLYERPGWLMKWRDVVAAFLDLIRGVTTTTNGSIQPVLFFFDETEEANPILINWIEEWIINPVLRLPGCAVVWTARQPWRWKRPEVRQKLESHPLPPFNDKDVRDQLRGGDIDLAQELFGRVYQVTEGHPYAGNLAVQKIHQWQIEGEALTADFIWDRRAILLHEIFELFIEKHAFKGLAEIEKTALKLVSLVRIFDNRMLQTLMEKHGGKQLSIEETQELLLRLQRTQLLVWKKGHSLDPELRHLIRNYYLTNEPNTFVAVNQTALMMNQFWLGKPVDNMNLFVIEELYHLASLQEAGQPENIEVVFQKRLDDYAVRWDDPEIRQSALERLAGELKEDKDLAHLTKELSKTVLVKMVQDHIKKAQESLYLVQL